MHSDATADTIIAPPHRCTCCGGSVSFAEWIANATRRPWVDLGLEILEHACMSTLAVEVNAEPAVVR